MGYLFNVCRDEVDFQGGVYYPFSLAMQRGLCRREEEEQLSL